MPAGDVRTFDPEKYKMTVNGVPIGGFADGTKINVEMLNDAFTDVAGTDGDVARVKSNDFRGTITVTLMQTSPSNTYLTSIEKLDRLENKGVVPILVKDFLGDSVHVSSFSWIVKQPANGAGKELQNREWVFRCAYLDMFTGGNLASS